MTRQDQIIEAAKPYADDPTRYLGFMDGATWADKHPQKAAKGKRPRWMSADGHPYRDGYYVTEDARGALAVCLWDTHGWHYAWAPVVRWLDMRLEKEK